MERKSIAEKGFTMVEIIVTMTVFVMLVLVATVGILNWQDYSDRRRQEEYAQNIYLAAQQELASYISKGLLKDLQKSVNPDKEGICHITAEKNDYSAYKSGNTTASDSAELVFRFLEKRIGDAEVLNGYIAIDYHPDGMVKGVYYCDKEDRENFMGYYGGEE